MRVEECRITDKFSGEMLAAADANATENVAQRFVRWNALLSGLPSHE